MTTVIETLCNNLKNSSNIAEIKDLLYNTSLTIRNLFYITAKSIPHNLPVENKLLADKIIQATTCVGLTNKKIVCWNIDSLRAGIVDQGTSKCVKTKRIILPDSPMGQLIQQVNPDIICLQETKLKEGDEKCFDLSGFHTYWNSSRGRKGYSGVAIWTKQAPIDVTYHLPNITDVLDLEGRIITAYFEDFVIVNTYTPNTLRAGNKPKGGWEAVRNTQQRQDREAAYNYYISNRMQWDAQILIYLQELQSTFSNVIWCGDLNVARGYQDIYNGLFTEVKLNAPGNPPSRLKDLNSRIVEAKYAEKYGGGAGYRLEERVALENILRHNFVDVFRVLYPHNYGFTYWERTIVAFRKANNGWRIDYFVVSSNLLTCIRSLKVLKDIGVVGPKVPSDHAPLVLSF